MRNSTRHWPEHEGLDARMTTVAAAVIGSAVVGAAASSAASKKASSAANNAAASQSASAQAGIDEQQRQFDKVRELLNPYVNAGQNALTYQQNMLGVNGRSAQQNTIDMLENSPQFAALAKQGENSILQNASATGGLRGGNVQGALAQFRPALLSGLIDQQYQRLGGLTSIGQNAAAGVGNAGMSTGNQISSLLQQQGAANAGAALAGGRAQAQGINGASNAFGQGLSGLAMYNAMNQGGGSITQTQGLTNGGITQYGGGSTYGTTPLASNYLDAGGTGYMFYR